MTSPVVLSFATCYHIQVGKSLYDQDVVLQWALQYAVQQRPPRNLFQVEIVPDNNSNKNDNSKPPPPPSSSSSMLQMTVTVPPPHNHSIPAMPSMIMKQRNAILRTLIGSASLSSSSSQIAANPTMYAIQSAATTYYMSMADSVRNKNTEKQNAIFPVVQSLQQHLVGNAFLLPASFGCTLADYDLAVALLQSPDTSGNVFPPTVYRWLCTTACAFVDACSTVGIVPSSIPDAVLAMVSTTARMTSSSMAALFFYADGAIATAEVIETMLDKCHSGPHQQQKEQQRSRQPVDTNQSTAKMDSNPAEPQPQPQQQQDGKGIKTKAAKKASKKEAQTSSSLSPNASATVAATTAKSPSGDDATSEFDITALDIRIGQILDIWPHPEADKLYCEKVDMGNGEIREIASGLRLFYPDPATLKGCKVLVLCNLKKRTMLGFASHGMVLCASNDDHSTVQLIVPSDENNVQPGDRVIFDGFNHETFKPEPDNKIAKKRIWEKLAPQLKTNANSLVVYEKIDGTMALAKTQTTGCTLKAMLGMPLAHVG